MIDKDKISQEEAIRADAQAEVEGAESAGTAPSVNGVPAEIPVEVIRRLEDELGELRDRQLRLMAEYDNYRKRTLRERDEIAHRAQGALAVRLLEVLDDLERLVASPAPSIGGESLQQALVLIDRKFRKELDAAGLERLDPVGQPFDPAVAEAVSVIAPPDPAQDHTVSATFQPGYRFKGSLIRPARVQVYSSEGHA